MAGALVDDVPAGAASSGEVKDEVMVEAADVGVVPELPMPNQKVGVVSALLAIGDVNHAMFFLARFPRLTASHPEVADLICRLIHVMIQDVYSLFSPCSRQPQLAKRHNFAYRYPIASADQDITTTRVLSPQLPAFTATQRYEYFYPNWKDELVHCYTAEDLVKYVYPLLTVVGVRIHRDTTLVAKLCRIGAGTLGHLRQQIGQLEIDTASGKQPNDDTDMTGDDLEALRAKKSKIETAWIEMTRFLFLPTVSVLRANTGSVVLHEQFSRVPQFTMMPRKTCLNVLNSSPSWLIHY